MICPKCKQAMVVVEYHQIELDYCTRCEGVWFDGGELDLLLQSVKMTCPELEIKNIINLPDAESSDKPRKCPICGQGMKAVAIGQPAIGIDVCRRADGLWFDGGELNHILKQTAENSAAKACPEQLVFGFLGEVFRGSE
ncbi:MAG: zf-TFIIB domain-containing protein [Chloroflexota bacterium]